MADAREGLAVTAEQHHDTASRMRVVFEVSSSELTDTDRVPVHQLLYRRKNRAESASVAQQ